MSPGEPRTDRMPKAAEVRSKGRSRALQIGGDVKLLASISMAVFLVVIGFWLGQMFAPIPNPPMAKFRPDPAPWPKKQVRFENFYINEKNEAILDEGETEYLLKNCTFDLVQTKLEEVELTPK